MRPRPCSWRRAAASPAPTRRTSPTSIGVPARSTSGSPPGSSRTSAVRPSCIVSARAPNRPEGIQLVPQRVFVLQHLNGPWSRMLRPRHQDQHRSRSRGAAWIARAAKDELTVLEDSLKAFWNETRGRGFDGGPPFTRYLGCTRGLILTTGARRTIFDFHGSARKSGTRTRKSDSATSRGARTAVCGNAPECLPVRIVPGGEKKPVQVAPHVIDCRLARSGKRCSTAGPGIGLEMNVRRDLKARSGRVNEDAKERYQCHVAQNRSPRRSRGHPLWRRKRLRAGIEPASRHR